MKLKIFLLTAALTLSITACHTTNDPLEIKIDEVLSKNEEIENKTDVNNDLHVDNSVENVENSQSEDKPAVENSPDSTVSEDENDENHDFVKDPNLSEQENPTDSDTLPETETDNSEKLSTTDPEKVENLTPDDIFYINGVPHIKAVLTDNEPETSEFSIFDLKSRFENASIIVLCTIESEERTEYFDRNKMPIKLESLLPKTNSFIKNVTVFEVINSKEGASSGFITYGGEMSLQNYKAKIDPSLNIDLFPENTIVDCTINGGDIPHEGDICLYFLVPNEDNPESFYRMPKSRPMDMTGTTYIIRDGGIYFGDEYIGDALEILTELRTWAQATPDSKNTVFYVNEEPHIRKHMPSFPPLAVIDISPPDLKEDIKDAEFAVIGKVLGYDVERYDANYTNSPPDIMVVSDEIPLEIEIVQVIKDENSELSDLKTLEFYYNGGEFSPEQYKKYVSPDFPAEIYPENTVLECGFSGVNIPLSGGTYLFLLRSSEKDGKKIYSNYYLYEFFEIENGNVIESNLNQFPLSEIIE